MNVQEIDWAALERLRTAFLESSAGERDYWKSERDLASYDATFAQRIGWKWAPVLDELKARGWSPPAGTLWDWGCGTGIAARVFLDRFGPASVTQLTLSDRSPLAVAFAKRRALARFPGIRVVDASEAGDPSTLLLSHVLTELSDDQVGELLTLVRRSTAVLWIEPGTHEASRRLSRIRDELLDRFHLVAPCTHPHPCPMLRPENGQHWCHHFATPPAEVFTDGDWARFGTIAGVDLRSLPLSYVVLDQRPVASHSCGAVRLIGHPRIYKGYALLLGCDASGLHEKRLSKRNHPEVFRLLKKGKLESAQTWRCEGDEVVELKS